MARGDGGFKIRGNKIYVHGSINGKFYRKSTGKKVTPATKAWIKRADPLKVLAELVGEIQTQAKTDLEGFGRSVLELHVKNKSEEYQKDVLSVFDNYILPVFKNIPLESIKPIDIINFIESLRSELSSSRLKFVKIVFKIILDHAYDNELIEKNPFNAKTVRSLDLTSTKKSKEKPKSYTPEEVALILKEAHGWFKVFMDLAFKTGMRTGELRGLKWEDFDLENGILYLKRAISKSKIVYPKENGNKNHYREIVLFPSTVKLLKSYYEVRPSDEWLFVNKDGSYIKQGKSIVDHHFKPLLKKIGVEYKTLKVTRHTHISIMKYAGADFTDIQKTVGHREGSCVTEKHYVDPKVQKLEQRKKEAENRELLFNLIRGGFNSPTLWVV